MLAGLANANAVKLTSKMPFLFVCSPERRAVELKIEELPPSILQQSSAPALFFLEQVIWHVLILLQPQKTALKGHCCEPHTSIPSPALTPPRAQPSTPGPQAAEEAVVVVGCPPTGDMCFCDQEAAKVGYIRAFRRKSFIRLCILLQRSRKSQSNGKWLRDLEEPNSWQLPGAGHLKTIWQVGSAASNRVLATSSLPGRRGDRAERVSKTRELPFASS